MVFVIVSRTSFGDCLTNHPYKGLNRRSQRRSFNLVEFTACWKRFGVPKPRIVESDQVQLHLISNAGSMEANTLERPGAIIPHAGICAGGAG